MINLNYADQQKALLDSIINNDVSQRELLINPNTDFIRDRKLSLETMLKIIISMQGGSINRELYDYNKNIDVTSSAFIQQRDKITPEMFRYIFQEYNKVCNDTKTHKGYKLLAVDGSDVNIAYNPNSETYMPNGDNNNKGYNQFHINAIYDVLNKTYFDCIIQPKPKCNEMGACTDMVKTNTFEKSILLADRGYGSLNLLETIHRTDNLEYLFRIKNDWLTEVKALPMKELDTEITFELRTTQTKADKELYVQGKAKWISGKSKFGKYKKSTTWEYESPFRMTLRIVRFKITDNTYETIVTSLNRFEFPLEEIKHLYHLRWGIETSFRELKYAIGLINFHAKKESAIMQEIFARLIMYNFCERITMNVVVYQDKSRKWSYQVNYTMAIHICRDFYRHYRSEPPPNVELLIKKYILPVRPNRKDSRKIKPKSVVYFLYRVA